MSDTTIPRETPSVPCQSNPELWFKELRRHKRAAKQGCEAGPLLEACRQEAMERHLAGERNEGIWGGMDLKDREVAARSQAQYEVVAV
ncbi:MAG: WhiB family transcriptional regulator [Nocardioidaceae bacterium]|nr:WhiB family transcriptional regulator [Nocardioidaceae bacterium]